MELCIGIQAALACLAILSRIHFSKYKDGDIKGLKHIREEVQALRVLTRREAQTLVRTRVKQLVWTTIAILFASTCIAEGLLFKSMHESPQPYQGAGNLLRTVLDIAADAYRDAFQCHCSRGIGSDILVYAAYAQGYASAADVDVDDFHHHVLV